MHLPAGTRFFGRAAPLLLVLFLPVFASVASSQQGTVAGGELAVQTSSLPTAFVRREYRFQLQAEGGVAPVKWEISTGALPRGLVLSADGILSGVPGESGEFRFVVTVTDSGNPAHRRNQELVLRVIAPLLVEWSRYPKVSGQRMEGAVKVSNQTDEDFDLTFIAVAVNENGRATALGYQRFTLKKSTTDMEIPFGENLPHGTYEVNVDAVGEVAATNTIHRARLVANKLDVQQGP
jgi:Putative Ig domain